MNVLNTRDELVSQEEDRLERELAVAEVEEIFKTGTEQVQNHGIIITFGTEPADEGNSNTSGEGLVDAGLILKLGVLGLDGLELDGNLLTRDNVGTQVDITKRAGTDLSTDAVLVTDTEILR